VVSKFVIGTFGVIGLASCNYAVADAPCDYVKDVQTNWTQQIEKTSNIDRKVFPYVEDTRKCVMTMDVTISGQTYPAEGSYVFGPDMTENDACDNATVNAKKSIISEVSPEILSAKTELNCSTKPQENVQIVESLPQESVIQDGVPIITEKVIDTRVSNEVLYIPQGKRVTIGSVTIGFDPHAHKRGKCYANWNTGGTDCY
jgi:hypothetical protein